jgi:hypothetical protein
MFLISFYVKKITLNLIEERGNLEEKLRYLEIKNNHIEELPQTKSTQRIEN